MTDDLIVTMADVRAAGLCSRGSRKFCERNNINWTKFLQEGIPASELLKIDSHIMVDLVEVARARR